MNDKLRIGNPYPGLRFFKQEDEKMFFGRVREIRELKSLLIAHRVVLLYSKSGAGKTSLVNAGVIPSLITKEGFEVLPVARVRGLERGAKEPKGMQNRYVSNVLRGWANDKADSTELPQMSLSAFLKRIAHPIDQEGLPSRRLLIFDQFEELFTFEYLKSREGRKGFFRQVAQAIQEDDLLRVLFVIREDYLAYLDPYIEFLPELLRSKYRLERLREDGACQAIEKPLEGTGRMFAEGVASSLVQKLLAGGEYVEPMQLQVVCRYLWDELDSLEEKYKEKVTLITSELIDKVNIEEAIRLLYEQVIDVAEKATGFKKGDLRNWFDCQLITPAGTRGIVFQDPVSKECTGGIPNTVVKVFEDNSLIRAEERAGAQWYELTHDLLIEPIRKSNEAWREEKQRQQVKEAQERADVQQREAEWQAEIAKKLREQRRELKWISVTLGLISVLAVMALILSFYYRHKTAIQQKVTSAHQLSWIAEQELTADPELSVLLSMQAVSMLHVSDISIPPAIEKMFRNSMKGSHLDLTITGHHYPIWDIALNTRNNTVVSADEKGKITLWDIRAGKKSLDFLEHSEAGVRVAVNSDGKLIASSGLNKIGHVWDAKTGKKLFPLSGHKEMIFAITFSSDGKIIATGSGDKTAKLWDAIKGKELRTFSGHSDKVTAVAVSPDGKYIATGSEDKTAKLWDVSTGKNLFTLSDHIDSVRGVSFSPDGKKLATASFDKTVKVWNVSTGTLLNTLFGHTWAVNSVAFSPDGKYIASGSWDKSVILWDAETGDEVFKHTDFDGAVSKVVFSPDRKKIVAACLDGSITLRDPFSHKIISGMSDDSSAIYAAAYSRDGQRVVTGGADMTARVWDARTGYPLLVLGGVHTEAVRAVAFSYDGKHIVTGSFDKTAVVWDAITGKELFTLTGHIDSILSVAFSPDGKRIATASGDKTAKIWDAKNGDLLFTLSGHKDLVFGLAFSPDGKKLATSSWDKTVKLWDLSNGRQLLTLVGHKGFVFGVAFSHDGTKIATGSSDKTAKIWDSKSGKEMKTLSGHTDWVLAVTFSRDDGSLATGSADKAVKIWDIGEGKDPYAIFKQETGKELAKEKVTLYGHRDWISTVDFNPDGDHLISAGIAGTAKVWHIAEEQESPLYKIQVNSAHSEYGSEKINCVAFSHDGQQFATGSDDQTVKVWNAQTGKEALNLGYPKSIEAQIIFSPDGKLLTSNSPENRIRIWSADTGEILHNLERHKSSVTTVSFSPDSNLIISGSKDKKGIVWDARTGRELFTLAGHTAEITAVIFSPDGKTIATAGRDGKSNIWDPATGKLLMRLFGHTSSINAIAFSRNGKRIATVSSDRTAKVWDARTGKLLFTLYGHQGGVFAVAFSPDGKYIATGSRDGMAKLWNANDGTLVYTLPKHEWWIERVEFSNQGNILATSAGVFGKTVKIWDAKTGKPLHTFDKLSWSDKPFALSPDGVRIATGQKDKTIQLFNATTGKKLLVLTGHQQEVSSVAFSPDGKLLASLGSDNNIKMWNLENSKKIFSIPVLSGHTAEVYSVAFSADGNHIASASGDKTVRLWDRRTGKELFVLAGHPGPVKSLVFSPDGKSLIAGTSAKKEGGEKADLALEVWIWDLATRTRTSFPLKNTADLTSFAFSPDGKYIVIGYENGLIKLLNSKTGDELFAFSGVKGGFDLKHTDAITDIVYSRDGKYIATASDDRTSKLWDSATGKIILTMSGHTGVVQSVAFSSDGKRIATGGKDNTVKFWDTRTGHEVWSIPHHSRKITTIAFNPTGSGLVTTDAEGKVRMYALDVKEWIKLAGKQVTRSLTQEECKRYLNEDRCSKNIKAIGLSVQGRGQARKGNLNDALKSFREAQRLFPSLGITAEEDAGPEVALVLVAQGMDLRRKGDSDGALEKFTKALSLDSKVSFGPISKEDKERSKKHFNEGFKLLQKGKLHAKEAIKEFRGALTADPGSEQGHLLIGTAYGIAEEFDKAIEHLEITIKKFPGDPYIYALLGAAYSKKDSAKAIENVNKALQDDPNYGYGLIVLGKIERDKGNFRDAIKEFEKVKDYDPDFITAISESGAIYFDKMYEYKAAYEHFKKASELQPDDVEILANFAEANVAIGRFRDAYDLAQRVLSYPGKPPLEKESQLAMMNVKIVSSLLDKQYDLVSSELKKFVNLYNSVEKGIKSTWSYSGIENYILKQKMDEKHRELFIKLINILKKEKDKDLKLDELERLL